MKPRKLSIQAFGPFASKQEIDFTQLGNNPLFLINGPTGAGKSSILDAICFALYNQTTGAERDAQQMRSDHCDPATQCEVSLDFSLGEKHYRIWRSPAQERPKSRGEGSTLKVAEAKLWWLDGSNEGVLLVSKSVNDATAHINNLIGLGVEQFRQVMVLPQGKFRELLMADSKAREQIFGQLFETHIYKQIENKLKEQASGIKQALELHQSKIRGILEAANVESTSLLKDEIKHTHTLLETAKSEREIAREKAAQSERRKQDARRQHQQFEELTKKQAELESTLERKPAVKVWVDQLAGAIKAQGIYHLYINFKDNKSKYVLTNTKHEEALSQHNECVIAHSGATKRLREAQENIKAIDGLKAQQNLFSRYATTLITLQEAKHAHNEALKNSSKSNLALVDKKQSLSNLNDERDTTETKIIEYTSALESVYSIEHKLEKLNGKYREREHLDEIATQIKRAQTNLDKEQASLDEATTLYMQAKRIAKEIELSWHQSQSVLLARELCADQPCPVCGSKTHPQPAHLDDNSEQAVAVSLSDVDNARAQENTSRDSQQRAKDALSTCLNHLTELGRRQQEYVERLGHYSEMTLPELANKKQALTDQLQALHVMQNDRAALRSRLAVIKTQQIEQVNALVSIEAAATNHNNEVIAAQTTCEQLSAQVPAEFQDSSSLEHALNRVTKHIDELNKAFTHAQTEFARMQSALDRASATQKALYTQLAEQEKVSAQAQLYWQQALQKSDFSSIEYFLEAQLTEPQQNALTKQIEDFKAQLQSLEAVVKQLLDSLQGQHRADILAIEEELHQDQLESELKDKQWRELDARLQTLQSVASKLQKAALENAELDKQYSVIGTLNDVANGISGNKISLQRFVLSVLLDDVLIQASHRLNLMSKGRYQLLRKEDRAKGNKASGLELEVHDFDTGKPRSVATLSGGESFMAALSLALGLSDVVQSYAGGIRLDTLFIDEGFGSLDAESLDAAIRVLIDLQASGRMIGIISHVSELKEQMAKRIDVEVGKRGNVIKVITN